MTISDATRAQRVKRWTDQKSKWESKLEKANNPYDIDVAKARIAEADSALERLGALEEQVRDEKKNPVLKRDQEKKKHISKTTINPKNDTGSLGI